MQIVKKGDIPIAVKIIALFTMAVGAVEIYAITAMFADAPERIFLQTGVLDRLSMFVGGITNGIPVAGDGRLVNYQWILAEGLITVAIGFFLLKGYRAAWVAMIALSAFRLAMYAPFYALPQLVLNPLIIFFMFRPNVRRFFFRKEKLGG